MAKGIMRYDFEKKMRVLTFYDTSKFNNPSVVSEEIAMFHFYCGMLFHFYPNINLFTKLYAMLLSEKDELIIKNSAYSLNDLLREDNNGTFDSIEGRIRVGFDNGELNFCRIDDDPQFGNYYWWSIAEYEGKTDTVDPEIKKYVFSLQYYSPKANLSEAKYVDKMLQKIEKLVKAT